MRPLKITMTAFGPYSGTQVIDFSELKDRNFFLIHGPTGAGKTSMLDAMCYALFGESSGQERKGADMRCHMASLSTVCEVVFDFALGSDIYRVRRVPQQERAAKKGGGKTIQNAEATIWRRTKCTSDKDGGEVVQSQPNKVSEVVRQLLGFSAEQFRQVVVLPQGKFRQLLISDSKDRQEILEALFKTHIYQKIEQGLKDAAKGVEQERKEVLDSYNKILEFFEVDTVEELTAVKEDHEIREKEFIAEVLKLENESKEAQNNLNNAKTIRDIFVRLDEKRKELIVLESQTAEHQVLEAQIDAAQRAALLEADEENLTRRFNEVQAATKSIQTEKSYLEQAETAMKRATVDFEKEKETEPRRKHLEAETVRLQAYEKQVRDNVAARKSLFEKENLLKTVLVESELLQSQIANLKAGCENEVADLDGVRKLAAQVSGQKGQLANLEMALDAHLKIESLKKEVKVSEQKLQTCTTKLESAEKQLSISKSELEKLERKWIEEQASYLASKLEDGEPCAVCGSVEHPNPARLSGQILDKESIDELKDKVAHLEQLRKQAADAHIAATAEHTGLRAKMEGLGEIQGDPGERDSRTLKGEIAALKAESEKALQAEAQLQSKEAALTATRDKLKKTESDKMALDNRIVETRSDRDAVAKIVADAERDIPEDYRSINGIEVARKNFNGELDILSQKLEESRVKVDTTKADFIARTESHKAAVVNHERIESTFEMLKREFAGKMKNSGFADKDAYKNAKRKAPEIEISKKKLQDYRVRVDMTKKEISEAENTTSNLVNPNLEELQECADRADEALKKCLKSQGDLDGNLRSLRSEFEKITALAKKMEAIDERYKVVGQIAEIATGANPEKISFQRFVLGALLDEVLQSASDRFQIMSNGRYQLLRERERQDLRRAAGLNLEVLDNNTGTTRGAATLSGGESFLASLSLALGLADVVQSYAGGIRLETIFVDEGFGSLDPEALDLAIRALIDLQSGGRLVGIISHVPELKERIDARLEVKRHKDGSVATFQLA